MISRRTFVGSSLVAAAAAPLAGAGLASASTQPAKKFATFTPATAPTLNIQLVNNSGQSPVYAYVTGLALNQGNAWFMLQADGRTPYYPPSPAQRLTPPGVNVAIPLGSGSSKTITIPQLAGGRIWFSIGSPITFYFNPGPALVEPSISNPTDPNANVLFDFMEFTYNSSQLYADISMVDFVSIPIGLSLTDSNGTQSVPGLPSAAVDTIASRLKSQAANDGQGWGSLIQTYGGRNLRCISPYNGMVMNPSLFSGYYDSYTSQVWSKYSSTTLNVDTQNQYGVVSGRVSGGVLNFPGIGSFARPSTADIFSCATGPFNQAGFSPQMLAVLPRICAAFNRSTLLTDSNQPDGENVANYYQNSITNHYAAIVHRSAAEGYAFPYDDVLPSSGASNTSGEVNSGSPSSFTITVGKVY